MFLYHQRQWKYLQKLMKERKLPHALLFAGPKDLGKYQIALEFATDILCLQKQKKTIFRSGCQQCLSCQLAPKHHPDLLLIDPQKRQIKIEQIRDLQRSLSLTPRYSQFKIAIINKAHLMNEESQNAFLKLLEETPGEAKIILVSNQPDRLFSTIRSRLQTIKFYPLSQQNLLPKKNQKISGDYKEALQLAFGRPARMELFLHNPKILQEEKQRFLFIKKFLKVNPVQKLTYIHKLFHNNQNFNPLNFLNTLLIYQRMLLLQCLNAIPKTEIPSCLRISQKPHPGSIPKIKKTIKEILKMKLLLETTNADPRLVLENLVLSEIKGPEKIN